jgi:hypothetical protein
MNISLAKNQLRFTGPGGSLLIADYGLQKKLHSLNPANPPRFVQTQRSRNKQRLAPADPKSLERQIRQLLAAKISGNQIGIGLLLPEHLRLGTWDLLRSWSGQPGRPRRTAPGFAAGQ